MVGRAKQGGLARLKEGTVERLFMMSRAVPVHMRSNDSQILSSEYFSLVGLDVSHAGEASYIYNRCDYLPTTQCSY